jgi:hypothetical protein
MSVNVSTVDEAVVSETVCAICDGPVLDRPRAVIHRRVLYHGRCWLATVSAARRSADEIAAVSAE